MDMVLLAMASNHPRLSPSEEGRLKAKLFDLMADEAGWKRDPVEMAKRFLEVMDGVQSHSGHYPSD